ncbi:hypothetical protein P1X14_03655 [Sphingomonas sp. AOB5]|uniref:hypothetical protein n=1 Tax=Sphingomonas sp. AOB5 TaxID=3034017 RepID=UPI0023F79013|nr:hypothetical protein [Sphingomonas sp. AOB5]MDF7774332.1 hypothetical protein [Sphingomonas sp. AOB5]
MASFKRLSLILMTSCCGGALLSGCDGALSVASPGEGVIVVPAPTPAAPTPTPTPTPTPGTPAASCPAGTIDRGVVGSFRGCRLPSLITGTTTLAKLPGVAYEINGRVDVGIDIGGAGTAPGGSSAILTVAPGVIFYANELDADNDYLIVNRGSRILAEGTETAPIIFTSGQNLRGTATDESQGQWGGVILAGRAPISNCNLGGVSGGDAGCENVVEGTGTALYGGNAPADNSGVFRYVQIRYSGTILAEGVELQGLTLGGTGYGTAIDHVQVHNSSDDGIEIFGGRTNLKHIAITGADDDSLDYDVGWRGQVQFLLAIQKPTNTQSDNYMLEIDSNGGEDALPRTWGQIANFTFVHTTTGTNAAIRIRGGADSRFINGIVTTPQACLNIVAGADAGGKTTIRASDSTPSTTSPLVTGSLGALQEYGPPLFHSIYFACGTNKYAASTVNGITVTTAEQQTVVENAPSTNIVIGGTIGAALVNMYQIGTGPAAVTATNAANFNPAPATGLAAFFVNAPYLGAVSPTAGDSNATWFQRWTCNSNRANFGTTSGNCTAVPVN